MQKLSEQTMLMWNLVKRHLPLNGLIDVYEFHPELRGEIAKLLERQDVVIGLSRDKITFRFYRAMDKLPFRSVKVKPERVPDFSVFTEI